MKLVEKYFAFRVKVGYTSWGKQITKMTSDGVWQKGVTGVTGRLGAIEG